MRQTQSESQSSWSHYASRSSIYADHGNQFNRSHHRLAAGGGSCIFCYNCELNKLQKALLLFNF